jgi:hypothetical protein
MDIMKDIAKEEPETQSVPVMKPSHIDSRGVGTGWNINIIRNGFRRMK